jgi:hypothetical protein
MLQISLALVRRMRVNEFNGVINLKICLSWAVFGI